MQIQGPKHSAPICERTVLPLDRRTDASKPRLLAPRAIQARPDVPDSRNSVNDERGDKRTGRSSIMISLHNMKCLNRPISPIMVTCLPAESRELAMNA